MIGPFSLQVIPFRENWVNKYFFIWLKIQITEDQFGKKAEAIHIFRDLFTFAVQWWSSSSLNKGTKVTLKRNHESYQEKSKLTAINFFFLKKQQNMNENQPLS